MKRFFLLLLIFFSLFSNAIALEINITPSTWYEINTTMGTTIATEPSTMQVGIANYQARAFWEYSISDITHQFESINFASINITNIGWTHTTQLHTYEADAIPTTNDWFNWNTSDTWQNKVLYGWDDPFNRGPNNVFDITNGLSTAINNNYSYLGILLLAPSASGTLNTFSEVLANAEITISGIEAQVPVPEPSTTFLLISGLIGLLGFKKKFK